MKDGWTAIRVRPKSRGGEPIQCCPWAAEFPPDPPLPLDERRRREREAVEEAGGGESEGFEQAEQELIEHTSHGDEHSPAKISQDAFREGEEEASGAEYGEADEEQLTD